MTKEIGFTEVVCNKCGEEFKTKGDFKGGQVNNGDWIHEFNIQPGYGSFLDSSKVQFHICDDCLEEIIEEFEVKPIAENLILGGTYKVD